MFLSALKPMLTLCEEAIALAKEGNVHGARAKFDRVRMLQSLLTRAKKHNAGGILADLKSHNLSLRETQEQIQIAQSLNEKIDFVKEWIETSRFSFTDDVLLSSAEGAQLFLDHALPLSWDFNHDIAFVGGRQPFLLAAQLAARGQRKVVVLLESAGDASPDNLATLDGDAETTDFFLVLNPEEFTADHFAQLKAPYPPTCTLFGFEASAWDNKRFEEISHGYASAHIERSSVARHAKRIVLNWLLNLPTIRECQSISAMRGCLDGRDCLVVSPGPSLDDDIPALKRMASKFFIMASFRSAATLLRNDVIPDVVVWADPGEFSELIPCDDRLQSVPLMINEACHPKVLAAATKTFSSVLVIPEPRLSPCALSTLLHEEDATSFSGLSVATITTVVAHFFGAGSITLLGQDLSIGNKPYANNAGEAQLSEERERRLLPCEAIGGGLVNTSPDYMSFIEEFRLIAAHLKDEVTLINSTSSGAYISGWDHISLSQHPLSDTESSGNRTNGGDPWVPEDSPTLTHTMFVTGLKSVAEGIARSQQQSAMAAKSCGELIESDERDVTALETLEGGLSKSLDIDGYLLKYFISATSMAFAGASASATTLSENLRISSDYYRAIETQGEELGARLRTLSDLFIKQAAPCQFCGGEMVFSRPLWNPFLTELHCLLCKVGSHWMMGGKNNSVRVQRTPFDGSASQYVLSGSQQITVTFDTVESADSCVILGFPIGDQRALPGGAIDISLLAKANSELDVAACLRQFYDAPGSPRRSADVAIKFRLSRFWDRYEIPLSVPAVPPNPSGSAYEATYGLLTLWLDAGPEHKDRTHDLGHQSGIFEFADIQIYGEAFDARVL